MTTQTPEEYYENEENHGGYQFFMLRDFLNEMEIEAQDPDSFLASVPRTKMLLHAKNGIRHLNKLIKKTVKKFEITVPDAMYHPLPQDYVSWQAVYVVVHDRTTNSKRLFPLDINREINVAPGYLQDDVGELIFDDEGYIIQADYSNTYAETHKKEYFEVITSGQPSLDTSQLSIHGEFNIDEEQGRIAFSSDLEDKEIVMVYITDGLEDLNLKGKDVRINKILYDALWEYTYHGCISKRRSVPLSEKQTSWNRFKTLRHDAKLDTMDFDVNQLMRISGTATKQF